MDDIIVTRISAGVPNPEITLRPLMDLIVSVGSDRLALTASRRTVSEKRKRSESCGAGTTIGLKDVIFFIYFFYVYLFFTVPKW